MNTSNLESHAPDISYSRGEKHKVYSCRASNTYYTASQNCHQQLQNIIFVSIETFPAVYIQYFFNQAYAASKLMYKLNTVIITKLVIIPYTTV